MKTKLLIAILLLIGLAFYGCQNKKSHKLPHHKVLRFNFQEGDPPSLNPYVGVDLRSRCLFLALNEPLLRRDEKGDLTLAAAASYEISPDQKTYTFHIRPHLWSNQEPVTARHFENAWKLALDPSSPCIRADLFYPIKNAKKVKSGQLPPDALGIYSPDSQTLIVELDSPTPYFLELVATSFFLPLYTPTLDEPRYFNGPFLVEEHIPEEKLMLCKNSLYWDEGSVNIDRLHFMMIRDPMTALELFQKNELDIVGDPFSTIPFDVVPTLAAKNELESKVISRIFYLLLNTETFPLNNRHIRKALSLSIDRDAFTKHVFFGQEKTFSLLPQPLSMLNASEVLTYSQESSVDIFEKALEEIKLTRKTFPALTLCYAELSGMKKMAEFVQQRWKEVLGIEVKLKCSEWNVHAADLRSHNFEIGALHLTTLFQDPIFYFDLFRDKSSRSNYCCWESPNFQNLLNLSEKAHTAVERHEYLKLAERLLMEEVPAIPIFTQNFQYLKQKNVSISLVDLGIYDLKKADKTKEESAGDCLHTQCLAKD